VWGRQAAAKKQLATKGKGTHGEAYTRNAFALLVDQNICTKCHDVGDKTKIAGAQGPNLDLAADRLRPDWVEKWIANPKRLFPYDPLMPQYFKNAASPIEWQHTHLFAGNPTQQTRAVRDLLMDRRRLSDLLSDYTPPKTPPPKGP
jgi:hypothetical protein